MRPVVSIFAVIVLSLFAIACGSDDKGGGGPISGNQSGGASSTGSPTSGGGSATNATLLNPCTLFTKEDAAAALGQPVLDAKLTPAGPPLGQALCFYGAADQRSPSVQISLIQTAGMSEQVRKGGQSAKTLHDGTKASVAAKTDVSGIGQDAFIAATSIYVLKGDTHFSILLIGNGSPGDAVHSNALRTAAGKVVGKLP